jgi:hypothetical protein
MVNACVEVGVVRVAGWDSGVEEAQVPLYTGSCQLDFYCLWDIVKRVKLV